MSYVKNLRLILMVILAMVIFTGCNNKGKEIISQPKESTAESTIGNKAENTIGNITESTVGTSTENAAVNTSGNTSEKGNDSTASETEADYSNYFEGMEGTAVFYNGKEEAYYIYNKVLADYESSPCSSFKIISGLMGLESGVIDPSNSNMKWNGTAYPLADWNQDMDFKKAFQCSCVWYFRNVIDLVGKDYTEDILVRLDYGNQDISRWEGSSVNKSSDGKTIKELNGFWLESSLQISPRQQVDAMKKIFVEKEVFSNQNLDFMKEVMLIDNKESNIKIYGKTGSGRKDNTWSDAWFTGFFEKGEDTVCFAVRLNQPEAAGAKAKEIAVKIINGEFGK